MIKVLTRRHLILGVLLGATLAAVVWVSQGEEEGGASDGAVAVSSRAARTSSPRDATSDTAFVQLDRLTRRASAGPAQDAFVSRTWVTPPPPVKAAPPVAPSAPPLPFTYMGKMQEGNTGPITVYLVQGEQAYNVKKGDVIDKTYRVESINSEQIVLTYLPMAIKQTLTFGSS